MTFPRFTSVLAFSMAAVAVLWLCSDEPERVADSLTKQGSLWLAVITDQVSGLAHEAARTAEELTSPFSMAEGRIPTTRIYLKKSDLAFPGFLRRFDFPDIDLKGTITALAVLAGLSLLFWIRSTPDLRK